MAYDFGMPKTGTAAELAAPPTADADARVDAPARVADRPGARRGRRLPRSRERREQHDRRRPLRLPAGVGRRARQRHGVAHPVPLREARHRHRPEPPRDARAPHRQPLGPPRVLAAGRARRDGDRHRRGDRRRRRAQPAVRHPAAVGRPHHRHRVARAAAWSSPGAGARSFEFVVIGMVAIIAIGFTFGVFIGPPDPAAIVGRPGPPLRGRRLGAARGIHPRRDDHAARDLRAQRARARPVRAAEGDGTSARRMLAPRPPTTARHRSASRSRSRSCAASRPPACCARRSGTSRSRCSSPEP